MGIRRAIALGTIGLLAACSGGGGGGTGTAPTAPAFSGFSQVDPNATLTLDGTSANVDFANATSTSADFSNPRNADAALTTTFENGSVVAARVQSGGVDFVVDTRTGDTDNSNSSFVDLDGSNPDREVFFVQPATDFEYQTYGTWVVGNDVGTAGAFSVGGVAPDPARRPAGATYRGGTDGYAQIDGEAGYAYGTTKIATDFATATFETRDTVLEPFSGAPIRLAPELDLDGKLTVSGNSISGTVSSPATTGNMVGQFYGPAAEEVGGTFATSGSRGLLVGSFGAAR